LVAERFDGEGIEAMLGEIIAQQSGTVSGFRVIASDKDSTTLEVTAQGAGTLQGTAATFLTTYTQTTYLDGRIYGEGRSVGITGDGETATWTGFGVGRRTGGGFALAAATCGSFQTGAPDLAGLMSIAAVGEYSVDEDGNYSSTVWEWTAPG
jgi:hypothetical protein